MSGIDGLVREVERALRDSFPPCPRDVIAAGLAAARREGAREGAEAMREAMAALCVVRAKTEGDWANRASGIGGIARHSGAEAAWEAAAAAARALPLPGDGAAKEDK